MGTLSRLNEVATIKALLEGAEDAARVAGDELPGPEHLVVSAIALPDGTARRAFAAIGVDADQFAGAIEAAHSDALRAVGVTPPPDAERTPRTPPRRSGLFRSTPAAQELFHAAVLLAKRPEQVPLVGAHVVAASCGIEEGTIVRAFTAMGVDRRALGAAARAEASGRR